jgi:hypothetical protein
MIQSNRVRVVGIALLSILVASCESSPKGLSPQGPYLLINPSAATLDVGEVAPFKAVFGTADATPTWSSSNEAVATVSATGVVTALQPGFTTLIATGPGGVKNSASVSVVAVVPSIQLASGTAITIASAAARGSSVLYRIFVPTGSTKLVVTLTGGTGDADIYVRAGTPPTFSSYTCASENAANAETCTINNPPKGTYYILVGLWDPYAGASLKATVTP